MWCPPQAIWWTELQTVTEQQRSTTWPACTLIQPPQSWMWSRGATTANHTSPGRMERDAAVTAGLPTCLALQDPDIRTKLKQSKDYFTSPTEWAVKPSYRIRLLYKLKPAELF